MRVITGIARGCPLKTLPGEATRPTTEKVKEAIFSAIQFDVEGRRVLDLFAGSGQLGIEALSRGAQHAVFVDSSKDAVLLIRENLQKTRLSDGATVLCRRAEEYLMTGHEPYDLVFLDPPYGMDAIPRLLPQLLPHLSAYATVVCEHDAAQAMPQTVGPFSAGKLKKYGRIGVTIYRNR